MRSHVATPITRAMIETGTLWGLIAADLRKSGALGRAEPLTIERLSSVNLSALRNELGTLNDAESAFFERFMT